MSLSTLLSFPFVAILNLLVLLLWPASGTYKGERSSAVGVIILILTVVAIILDIVFLAKQF